MYWTSLATRRGAHYLIVPALLLSALALSACGGDDDDDGDRGPLPSSGDQTGDNGSSAPPTGGGSGTLTVDGQTFTFEVIHCGFSPDENDNEDVPFSLTGRGSADGREFWVDASIVDLGDAGAAEIHGVSIFYSDNFDEGYYSDSFLNDSEFEINGKQISYSADFYAEEDAMVGEGTFEATCP